MIDGQVITENLYRYAAVQAFQRRCRDQVHRTRYAPGPPPSRNEPHPLPARLRLRPRFRQGPLPQPLSARRRSDVEIPDLAESDFQHLTITRQLAVIDRAVRGQPASLIGSSMGGYLAALYAAAHREIDRVVLLAPAFGFPRRWPERLGAEKIADWRRTGWMDVYHYGQARNVPLAVDLLEDGARYSDFPGFPQPALIFHGAHDDVVPAAFSTEFASAHPNAHLEILNSGHELTDVLEYMAPKIAEFLGVPQKRFQEGSKPPESRRF